MGTFTVQIAKSLGAHVTAVTSTGNVDLVRSIDADELVDYSNEDFTKGSATTSCLISVRTGRSQIAGA